MIDFDFHTHTSPQSWCATQTLQELIERYSKEGIKVLAICNHDTLDGIDEARAECERAGIQYVSGVELTCAIAGEGAGLDKTIVHILGYNVDNNRELFNSYEDPIKRQNEERVLGICAYLRDKGYSVYNCKQLTTLWAQLVEKGICENTKSARRMIYSDEFESRFPTAYLSHRQGIELIHRLNGLAVWAHPKRVWLHEPFTFEELDSVVDKMQKCGLDGIEVFYPAHFEEKGYVDGLLKIAKSKNLIVTLGSDCHHLKDEFFPANTSLNGFDYDFESIKYFWK